MSNTLEIEALLDKMTINVEDSNYYYNGHKVPRVTRILSRCIHNEELMGWANHLGFKHQNYKDTLEFYSTIGTQCHNSIDTFLDTNTKPSEKDLYNEAYNAFLSFDSWYNSLVQNTNLSVIYHEKSIACKYFGGTLDGLYNINGKTYLIDYKTSNHVRINYALQLAAYRYMLKNIIGLDVDGCLILQLSKKKIGFKEFILDFSKPEDLEFINNCEYTFMSLVLAYYSLENASIEYDKLNWR